MGAPRAGVISDLVAALSVALSAGSREAFTALLTEDVRWGGQRRGGGNECTNREQVGNFYAGMLTAGVTLRVGEVEHTEPTAEGEAFTARIQLYSPDSDAPPTDMAVRFAVRGALIADICVLDAPPSIEVLYFDGCPNFEAFLPHLHELLDAHGISTPPTLIRIDNDDDAQNHRFLGSPTVRVNGHDVEPAAVEGEHRAARNADTPRGAYGMQCRLYFTAEGTTGAPLDEWIVDALVDNPVHEAAVAAIHSGDLPTLQRLLGEHPQIASTRLVRREGRTLLHIATDWPGHYPNVAATIALLTAAGADPNTPFLGEHAETPLHWAASSDDITAIDALLDAGADIDAPGAIIGVGTPLADATAFGQWNAASRLLERGATTNLFQAAALGLLPRLEHHLTTDQPTAEAITSSFWGACHGGHVNTATVLLEHGADINWVGYDGLTPLEAARRADAHTVTAWLEQHGATTATPSP